MKSYTPLVLIAAVGVVAFAFADSSPNRGVHSEPAAAGPRFAIHGDGDNRLMFDNQTGETWIIKTVVPAMTDLNPSPMAVWFPVPLANDSLVREVLNKRSTELTTNLDGEAENMSRFLAEKEAELGADHPDLLKQGKEIEDSRKTWAELFSAVESTFAE